MTQIPHDATRTERDSMGEMEVPADALYGASTQRAVLNFPISGTRLPLPLIHAYGLIKKSAAQTNAELGLLDPALAAKIAEAATEIADGKHDAQFPVDIYQTGSGTSTNTNVNEVIVHRCTQLGATVHPNDHVNLGQSSNDTFPTAIHLAAAWEIRHRLVPALANLAVALDDKAREFHGVLKIGRTHLMDATPVRLGQEFGGWARQAALGASRAARAEEALLELPLGGTAVGTGLNAHPDFAAKTIARLAEMTGIPFREAEDHFEAQASKEGCVEAHGQLATIAVSLHKIACDIRLLGSGPRCGLGEIRLPATQPGSSIMPGKVNPVMAESVTMVAARVAGNQTTLAWCGAGGFLELNVSMPLIAACLLESIGLLGSVAAAFRERCVEGIQANESRCNELIELSLSMVTALAPRIGYDRAAAIAKESVASGRTVREICESRLDELGLTAEELAGLLDAARDEWGMIPGISLDRKLAAITVARMESLSTGLMEQVDYLAGRSSIMENRYFSALRDGTMRREDFVRSQKQFFFAVRYFSRPMAALMARMADSATRQGLIHNLSEEHGFEDDEPSLAGFDPSVAHDLTFLEFLATLGIDRHEMAVEREGPAVRAFNTALMGTCLMERRELAFGCLGVIEYAFADICELIGRKVVENGWIAQDDLVHYKLHAQTDKRHAADFFQVVEGAWHGGDTTIIESGIMLGLYLFNRLYEDLDIDQCHGS